MHESQGHDDQQEQLDSAERKPGCECGTMNSQSWSTFEDNAVCQSCAKSWASLPRSLRKIDSIEMELTPDIADRGDWIAEGHDEEANDNLIIDSEESQSDHERGDDPSADIGGDNAGAHFYLFSCTVFSGRCGSERQGRNCSGSPRAGQRLSGGDLNRGSSCTTALRRAEFAQHALRYGQPSACGIGRRRSVERMHACTCVRTYVRVYMFMCSCMRMCTVVLLFGVSRHGMLGIRTHVGSSVYERRSHKLARSSARTHTRILATHLTW